MAIGPEPGPSATGAAPAAAGLPPAPPAHGRGTPLWTGEVALPSTGPPAASFLAVLGRRDFRLLWGAQAAAQLADKFMVFSLLIVLYSLTGRSSTQSLVMLAYTLPSVLLSAPAGVYADRHDKRRLMMFTSLARAGLLLLIPVCLEVPGLAGQAWLLLLITAAFSSVGQLFAPAEAASIPFLVRSDQLVVATSLFMTTLVGTLVAGVPLATLALRLLGRTSPFYVAAALFVVAAGAILAMRTPLLARSADEVEVRPGVLRELRDGLAILAGEGVLRVGVLQLTVALVVVFTMFALGPAFVAVELGRPPDDTYQLLVPAIVGLLAAAVVLGRRGGRLGRARAVLVSVCACGALLVLTGLLPGWLIRGGHGEWLTPLILGFGVLFGGAMGCLLIVAFSTVQEHTTEDTRGRIFGGVFTVINGAVALPLLLAGSLADALGVSRVAVLLGALLLAYGVGCRALGWRSLRLLDAPGRPGTPAAARPG